MLAGGGIGPFAGYAGWGEADEERASAGAANVAGGPVASVLAAVGEVAPADFLGARAEGGGDGGGVRAPPPARMTAPAKPERRTDLEIMGAPLSRLPGERPVPAPSGSCRRRDGGRCAKREPCRPAGGGSGRAA